MNIFDALQVCKFAINSGALSTEESAVVCKDGFLWCSNPSLTIKVKCESPDFAAAATPLLKALKSDSSFRVTENLVVVKTGSIVERFSRLNSSPPSMNEEDSGRATFFMKGWLAPLKQSLKFAGEEVSRPWTMGAFCKDGYLFTTNDVCLSRSRFPFSIPFEGRTIPRAFADFITAYADDVEDVWWDGSFRALLSSGVTVWAPPLTNQTPEKVVEAFNALYSEPSSVLPQEWKADVLEICSKVEDEVHLSADKVYASMINRDVIGELTTDVERACYTGKALADVLKVATHADFKDYPKPVSFKGDMLCGIIAGRVLSR